MRDYIGWGMKRDKALDLCGVSKHQYYNPLGMAGKRGRKPSTTTILLNDDGSCGVVENDVVAGHILDIKSDPETDYGYKAMTAALMLLGFVINHKKVYRIMKELMLLHDPRKKATREYVKYARVCPSQPLEVIEMDIKFQYVIEHARYAFILTVLDCFTRKVLQWLVGYSIRQEQIKMAWEQVIVNYLQAHDLLSKGITVEVRNDNDTRFAAKNVQQYFKENHIHQVFTHPYTPQENGHVESFHSILGRSLDRKDFATIDDLNKHLKRFYKVYNDIRLHGSLDHLAPKSFWKLWKQGYIDSYKTKTGKLKHRLKIPHYQISGNGNLREVSSLNFDRLDAWQNLKLKVIGADSLHQPSVQR